MATSPRLRAPARSIPGWTAHGNRARSHAEELPQGQATPRTACAPGASGGLWGPPLWEGAEGACVHACTLRARVVRSSLIFLLCSQAVHPDTHDTNHK